MKYEIGQILFLMGKSSATLLPARIIQEVSIKTLNGEEIEYTAEVITGKDGSNLEKIKLPNNKVTIFESVQSAKESMLNNAKNAINEICDRANQLSVVFEPAQKRKEEPSPKRNQELAEQEPVHDTQTVILDDGTIAKINLPPELDMM